MILQLITASCLLIIMPELVLYAHAHMRKFSSEMDVRFLLHFFGVLLLAQPLSVEGEVEGDAGATGMLSWTGKLFSIYNIIAWVVYILESSGVASQP